MAVTVVFLTAGCSKKEASTSVPTEKAQADNSKTQPNVLKKKVLYIDSYHRGYEWSDGVTNGILLTFKAKLNEDDTTDNSRSKVDLKIFRMDTKRNASEEFKQSAALKAKNIIELWKPDVVITSDDNAFKYLIMPYYKDADLPIVFCGLNWDASIYDAPYTNTTGMIEVSLLSQLIDHLAKYSHGNRIGYLAADVLTARKEGYYYKTMFGLTDLKETYVKTLDQWKAEFIKTQEDVDILIFGNNAGINDWNQRDVKQFTLEHIKIPTGAIYDWLIPYSMIGFTKIPEEQGEYAAKTAVEILKGRSPADIPVVSNEKAKVYLNMGIAKKLGIVFPMDLIDEAELFSTNTECKN